jgi:hypothetical protein
MQSMWSNSIIHQESDWLEVSSLRVTAGTTNRSRMHVFADLKPYICTYENCPSALVTFPDRKSWAQHEFSCHRSDVIFKCDDCDRELPNEAAFSAHVEEYHVAKLSNAQLLALAAAAREIRHHPANEQLCPLCLQNGWQDERKFITHVAQHMEDIALGAVPRNDDTDTEATNAKSPHISTTTSDDSDKPSSSVCSLCVNASLYLNGYFPNAQGNFKLTGLGTTLLASPR